MLDVILYGNDRRGRLTAWERKFPSLRSLAHFFHTAESASWEWAEVCRVGTDGRREFVRYSAEGARVMVGPHASMPSRN